MKSLHSFTSGQRRPVLRTLAGLPFLAVGVLAASGIAAAQTWPIKPVRVIVNFPPGGGTDVTMRILQPHLAKELGQPIIIDNRGGAAGAIGAEIAAKAAPDGYTLLWTLSSHTTNPSLYEKLNFNTERDFAAITLGANGPQLLVANMALPVKDIKDLIAYAKANPGKLNYATPGVGSPGHLAGELFAQQAGIQMAHIPYKGAGPAIPDVIGGQVQLMFASAAASLQHVRSGKLRALGVTSAKRSAGAPEIPAIAESMPGYELPSWFGMLAPAGTPKAIIDRVNQATVRALAVPEVRDNFIAQGFDPVGSTPQQFTDMIRAELKMWPTIIKKAGIKGE
jgi:tripartite-type tricarboxylate transporter receptor subunit TctC